MQQPPYLERTVSLPTTAERRHAVQGPGACLLTPASTTDSEGLGSLPSSVRGGLFSPLELNADISGGSLQLERLITPKRKLSMDLDESTQDASDSGYGRSVSTCTSGSSCHSSRESSLNFSAALEGVIKQESGPRIPLGELSTNTSHRRNSLHARRAKRSISFANEQDKNKKRMSENVDSLYFHAQPSSLPSFPSLPYSPLSQESSRTRKNSLLQQISSPLERMTLLSPAAQPAYNSSSQPSNSASCLARQGSVESDGYSEVFDGEEGPLTASLPGRLTTLMHAPFPPSSAATSTSSDQEVPPSHHKPATHSTPLVRTGPALSGLSLTRADSWSPATRRGSLKRASPCPVTSQQLKRKKPPLPVFCDSKSQDTPAIASSLKGVQLSRSQSCSVGAGENFIYPISPGSDNGDMIGDFSKIYALPLVKSKVSDLKCISPETLAELIKDNGSGAVDEYSIVDCRYPYEYEGGHIQRAQNIWEKSVLSDRFFSKPQYTAEPRRRIIIFHCEFSSKRGPDMSRFMRQTDRKKNDMAFPKLYYPELYLLDGGYKAFYEKFPELCEPNCYVQMLDDNHKEALRHFKHRSKSWPCGDAATSKRRGSHLRPRRSTVDNHTTDTRPQKS